MTMPGTGCFVAWYDLSAGRESGHDHWHTHEHMIERVAIRGFLRGIRYRSLTGNPRVCVVYQVETLAVLASAAYLERLNNPTPWTRRSMTLFAGMNRTMCTVASTHGHGTGGYLLTIQLGAKPGAAGGLKTWLSAVALPALAARAGLCGAHLLLGDRAVSQTPTEEKALRGAPDAIADWVVLVEAYDRAALELALAELDGADGLAAHGADAGWRAGLYSLDFTLEQGEAKKIWRLPHS
jgi:hypothetical protein